MTEDSVFGSLTINGITVEAMNVSKKVLVSYEEQGYESLAEAITEGAIPAGALRSIVIAAKLFQETIVEASREALMDVFMEGQL